MSDSLLPLLLVTGARDALRSAAADLSLTVATTDDDCFAVDALVIADALEAEAVALDAALQRHIYR